MDKLASVAEREAQNAQVLSAFQRVNLQGIRSEMLEILSLFGRESIFSEYTKHDASHIDGLLASLDWLIPDETKNLLTPSEWLLLVLGIYLHDVGLIVTSDEFDKRGTTNFQLIKRQYTSAKKAKTIRLRFPEWAPMPPKHFCTKNLFAKTTHNE